MAELFGLLGWESTGKTYSIRNLPPQETFIIQAGKDMLSVPNASEYYREADAAKNNGYFNVIKRLDFKEIHTWINIVSEQMPHIKYLLIDDITHQFTARTMNNAFIAEGNDDNKRWSRWDTFGNQVYIDLLGAAIEAREDLNVIMTFHPEEVVVKGQTKIKIITPGSMLDRKVKIPSYFNCMLCTHVIPQSPDNPLPRSSRYVFITNDDGYYPAKMPIEIKGIVPNDIKPIIEAYRLNKLEGKPVPEELYEDPDALPQTITEYTKELADRAREMRKEKMKAAAEAKKASQADKAPAEATSAKSEA